MHPTDFESSVLNAVFFQTSTRELLKVREKQNRFVHYTSADTAFKILRNKELWLRNAAVMNDFSEVRYGIECLRHARNSPPGIDFERALAAVNPHILKNADQLYDSWLPSFQNDTFLTSFAVHDDDEDEFGRLSMWRAYGDVAIVFKHSVLTGTSPVPTGATITPVSYFSPIETERRLSEIAQAVRINHSVLANMSPDYVVDALRRAMRFAVLANKHPGFKEEREWRMIHSPNFDQPRLNRTGFAGDPNS